MPLNNGTRADKAPQEFSDLGTFRKATERVVKTFKKPGRIVEVLGDFGPTSRNTKKGKLVAGTERTVGEQAATQHHLIRSFYPVPSESERTQSLAVWGHLDGCAGP